MWCRLQPDYMVPLVVDVDLVLVFLARCFFVALVLFCMPVPLFMVGVVPEVVPEPDMVPEPEVAMPEVLMPDVVPEVMVPEVEEPDVVP